MPKGLGGNDRGGGRGHSSTQKQHKGREQGWATGGVLCLCVHVYLYLYIYVCVLVTLLGCLCASVHLKAAAMADFGFFTKCLAE